MYLLKINSLIYFFLTFLLFSPVFKISGGFLIPQEFAIYGLASIIFLFQRIIRLDEIIRCYITYLMLFIISVLISIVVTQTTINADDIFIIRMIIQSILLMIIFSYVFDKLKEGELQYKSIIYNSYFILTLPAVIGFIAVWDLFGLGSLITELYQPQFGYLDADFFIGFRTTSIFKDFYTASIYFTIICGYGIYIFYRVVESGRKKNVLLILVFLNYSVLFYTGRTGLVFVPVFFVMLLFLDIKLTIVHLRREALRYMLLIVVVLSVYFLYLMPNSEKFTWALEVFKLFDSNESETFTSVTDMSRMNNNFVDYFLYNPMNLFVPNHVYDVSYIDNTVYTDNYYFQEIYRYGIYGLVAIVSFSMSLLFKLKSKSNFLFLMVLILCILNFKGGNTFFAQKNIYIFSFLMTIMYRFETGSYSR